MPDIIIENLKKARLKLLTGHLDPRTNLIYDYCDDRRDRNLSTPREIAEEIPSAAGWVAGMEDTAIAGSAFLDGLLRGCAIGGDAELARHGHAVWEGLKLLGTVSPTRGFICRGVLPCDRKSHYPNSSADQYLMYCGVLGRYYHSPLAGNEDKRIIRDIIRWVCERVMNADMNIPREDDAPSIFGDLGRAVVVEGQSTRIAGPGILLLLKMADWITGAAEWSRAYKGARDAHDRAAIKWLDANVRDDKVGAFWIVMQSAYAFRLLFENEDDPAVRAVYRTILNRVGSYASKHLERFYPMPEGIGFGTLPDLDWRKDYAHFHAVNGNVRLTREQSRGNYLGLLFWNARPGLAWELQHIQESMECLTAVMLSDDAQLITRYGKNIVDIVSRLPVNKTIRAASLYTMETIYWRGRELALW